MRKWFRKIRAARFRYEPLITIFIHRDRIIHNLSQFRAINPDIEIAPVLKSNAYGHGLVQVAEILKNEQIPFLCVDSYPEALILRNEGATIPLLIIGYTIFDNVRSNRLKKLSFGVTSMHELRRISSDHRGPLTIHLKVDTGMHRQGILMSELTEALDVIKGSSHITLDGLYSHLADADTPGSPFTKLQIEAWNNAVREVKEKVPNVRYFHLSNTAGSYHAEHIHANVMRLGIGLYGFNTSADQALDLVPALEMKTRITSVREINPGDTVGYNATFEAKQKMTVATIPAGYAEGIDRRLSNRGSVTVGGVACPMIGRINMNITSIDVTGIARPHIDDEVVAISAEPEAPNSISGMARLCDAIPYELLVRLPAQLRRVVIN